MDDFSAYRPPSARPLPQRRRGRGVFMLGSAAALCAQAGAVLLADDPQRAFSWSFPLLLAALAAWAWRRFHDIGLSGWWSLVLLVPFLTPPALLALWLAGATRYPNEYGDQPEPSPWWLRLAAIALLLTGFSLAQSAFTRMGWTMAYR